jgi:hypothetical protein
MAELGGRDHGGRLGRQHVSPPRPPAVREPTVWEYTVSAPIGRFAATSGMDRTVSTPRARAVRTKAGHRVSAARESTCTRRPWVASRLGPAPLVFCSWSNSSTSPALAATVVRRPCRAKVMLTPSEPPTMACANVRTNDRAASSRSRLTGGPRRGHAERRPPSRRG